MMGWVADTALPSWSAGLVRLARPLQLSIWTGSTILLGLAASTRFVPGWGPALLAVAVGGVALQGYITHGLNDLYDWQSGTDQTTPGRISPDTTAARRASATPSRRLRGAARGPMRVVPVVTPGGAPR